MSKRSNCSSARTPSAPKRPRTSPPQEQQDDQPPPRPYPRLQAARFPPEIRTPPHVLKQVDIFLMTDDEAVMEAAKTGDVAWLRGLVEDVNDEIVTDALVEASGHGHAECVEVLMDEFALEEERLPYICWKRALNAIEAAATNGHLEVVKVLLCRVSPGSDTSRKAELYGTVRHALSLVAEGGHLDLVKLTVQHARSSNDDRRVYGSSALARAISAGEKVVVEYLLGVAELSWDLDNALVAAVDVEDIPLADRMYKLYVKTHEKEKLFTSLACCGKLKALKYLYQTGHRDPDLTSETFVEASERTYRGTDVLDFLLSTGLVSSEAFDKGFQRAVAFSLDDVNVIAYLLDKKRATPVSINKAFVAARTCAVVNFLLEHKDIREESIRAAFERAMRSLSEFYPRGKEEYVQIIKLLYAKDCIPAKIIGEAFVIAATKGHSELVTLLRCNDRISARMVNEAFVAATKRGTSDIMMSLYGTNISPDTILIAFSTAITHERIGNVKELAKLLSDANRVPQEFKHKAFVIAGQYGYNTVLPTFCESDDDFMPLAILKEALAVAKRDEVRNVIRKVICDQLFDPKCPWSR